MRDINFPALSLKDGKAKYLHIAESIRESIRGGILQPNELLPSTRKIAEKFEVHRHTVMTALEMLIVEGWIISKQRVGYQVCEEVPDIFAKDLSVIPVKQAAVTHSWDIVRDISFPSFIDTNPNAKWNFQNGSPDYRIFPLREYRSCLDMALELCQSDISKYCGSSGYLPFVEEIKAYMRRLRSISDREIIVTNGAQEAVFIIAQLLLGSGDSVAVESPGCIPLYSVFQMAGADLVPIPVDREGMDPDRLEEALRRKKIKLIYLTPLHQYPTTVTLSKERRAKIYDLASKYGVVILEDDYDHEYHYQGQPLLPMVSNDPENRIIYVSSLSKILLPSLRIGFLIIPKELVDPIKNIKHALNIFSNVHTQAALMLWIQSGGFERHLLRSRQVYHARRDVVVNSLKLAKENGFNLQWAIPDGGIALWLNTNQDSSLIAKKARAQGILISSNVDFQLIKSEPRYLRICYSTNSQEELFEGINTLLKCF